MEEIQQKQIAKRTKMSLSRIRQIAMDKSFPPVQRVGGPTGRTNFYATCAVDFYFRTRVDGRTRKAKRR